MNSYEEIQQLLEKKEFKSALLVAFSNSLKFKLTSKITNQKEPSSMETEIDLLKGLTTKASDAQILNSNHGLMRFHSKQLENVHEIWNRNRQIVISILEILTGHEVSSFDNLKKIALSLNSSTLIEPKESIESYRNQVDDIVDLMLEENDDNHHVEVENNGENWLDETEEVSAEINDDSTLETREDEIDKDEIDKDEEQETMISAEQQQQTEESWNEFMDDLSAEEEAVTEEVIVNDVSPDEEIAEDWSEWLDDDDSNVDVDNQDDDDITDWSKEEEEEQLSNK